ncbi:MAG: AzlD domain-containing protein [Eggerthellaceae bacterium]|nr:AzlD domain-containing protein [Eggerthellaceae bacterium]
MSWSEFWWIFLFCAATILACRVVPLILLKGHELPDSLKTALGFIPPAAFAALVANDLLAPDMFASGLWPAAAPLIAALCVVIIALKTKSLLWSAIGGVVAYALLSLI